MAVACVSGGGYKAIVQHLGTSKRCGVVLYTTQTCVTGMHRVATPSYLENAFQGPYTLHVAHLPGHLPLSAVNTHVESTLVFSETYPC